MSNEIYYPYKIRGRVRKLNEVSNNRLRTLIKRNHKLSNKAKQELIRRGAPIEEKGFEIIKLTDHAKKRIKERYGENIELPNKIKKDFFIPGKYKTIAINGNRHIRQIKHNNKIYECVVDIKNKIIITALPSLPISETDFYEFKIFDLEEEITYLKNKLKIFENMLGASHET